MLFEPSSWHRFVAEDATPIYVRSQDGDWFVPNDSGDRFLREFGLGGRMVSIMEERFLSRLPPGTGSPYAGRFPALSIP